MFPLEQLNRLWKSLDETLPLALTQFLVFRDSTRELATFGRG